MADTITGFRQVLGSDPFDVPADINRAHRQLEDIITANVATTSALPAAGNWFGREIPVTADKIPRKWDGNGWVAGAPTPIFYAPAASSMNIAANATVILRGIWGGSPAILRGITYSGTSGTTGGQFTPQLPGLYEVTFEFKTAAGGFVTWIVKNGAAVNQGYGGVSTQVLQNRVIVPMDGANDYLYFQAFANTATAVDTGTAATIKWVGPLI